MKNNLFQFFFGKSNANTGIDMNYLFKRGIVSLVILTIVVCLFFIYSKCKGSQHAILNFLLLAAASFAGGSAIGFLFGLPRSTKYKFIKPENGNAGTTNEHAYSDNTNLEEVSDWLTKIIVGLSLVKFQTILFWVDKAAHNFEKVVNIQCSNYLFNEYVLGYCTIILYFLAGGGLVYLWSRVNLHVIFTDSRLALAEREKQLAEREKQLAVKDKIKLELEKKELVNTTQKLANEQLESEQKIDENKSDKDLGGADTASMSLNYFREEIERIYKNKGVPLYQDDLQKGRWGGNPTAGGFSFDAYLDKENSFIGLASIILRVKNNDNSRSWNGFVAFFLHDTFPSQIVYAKSANGLAEYKIIAYEAFVVGARTDTGVELELDLNTLPGFPESFYYK